jgi:hypothetical protein
LRIEEAAKVIAIDTDGDSRFDPEKRLPESRDTLTICSSLVSVVRSRVRAQFWDDKDIKVEELKLAHFSVKEYLISGRIRTGPASRYSIEKSVNHYIAQTCLIYLLYFRGPTLLKSHNIGEYLLARYAAQYWV